jgi:hypothetical protein
VTVNFGEQGVIFAEADISAGMPLGAPLAHDNIAGHAGFAAKQLYAEALTAGVAPVARRSACFFVCHEMLRNSVILLPRFRDECIN